MIIIRWFFKLIGLSWHLLHVSFQILYGAWYVFRVPKPVVTIFGAHRIPQTNIYFKGAYDLARMFVDVGISVLTGGGSGIMEGANCGALATGTGKGQSIGIGVKNLGEGKNRCVQKYFVLDYFFARKWLLTSYSDGFAVFPGGFGTLDELAEVLTLIETGKLKRVPIVLIGTEYWKPFIDWLHESVKRDLIDKEHMRLFSVTDDLYQAFCLLRDKCEIPLNDKK